MSDTPTFRTAEEEVTRLLEECVELRNTLRSINSHISRMETRLKRAFPEVSKQLQERQSSLKSRAKLPAITTTQALEVFDKVVSLVAQGHLVEAERILMQRPSEDLFLIAKELGVSFKTSKPSIQKIKEALFGKIRESVQLSRHHVRQPKLEDR